MSSAALTQRLQNLSETYKQTLLLIQELQSFPTTAHTTSPNTLDQQRLDLANECHDLLQTANDTLDSLRQDIDSHTQHDVHAATVSRLTEDLRSARVAFRRAQLQSKRNLDAAKRKEREDLFASRRNPETSPTNTTRGARRAQTQQHLTQDDLARSAAQDVTRALRRTHALLSANLQQSQFAQQTLEESQEQLRTLGDRYSGTTDLLKSSRGLVKTLVSAQKSDSWYLKTSVLLLLVTLGWLVFRRLLFGPLWWFVWWPGKIVWYSLSGALGLGAGLVGGKSSVGANTTRLNVPTVPLSMQGQTRYQTVPAKGAGWGQRRQPEAQTPEMVESVAKMMEDASRQQYSGDAEEVGQSEGNEARNTKKRMMEVDQEHLKDEL